ncbi:MAG: hypothetical protein J5978_09550 [Spirochaetaceae bacterium]|nr:hypothetical protein [Spirochaetaceae bacterium]MBO5483555.1 hypothetical protein [Spirochaetaceae bacterium]
MDLKVYQKEEITQPHGKENVYVPNVIDIFPVLTKDKQGNEILSNAVELTEDSQTISQMAGLSTIWQRGLDPLDLEDGIRWSEAILEEINVVQLMEDITNAVEQVTPSVSVTFDVTTNDKGQRFLTYKLGGKF